VFLPELLRELASPNEEVDGEFSGALTGIPDVDGDGISDLLVGAYREDPGTSPTDAGRAYVFSGASGELVYEIVSPNEVEHGSFGWAVGGVADIDGDDVSDLLIGAIQENPNAIPDNSGRAYVFSGATGALMYELASPNEDLNGYFGFSVAGVEDADGDGIGDLLIGARGEDPGASPNFAGRAYLFSGASGDLLFELASPNEEIDGAFGYDVSGVGDVDGDEIGDLLVSTPFEDPGTSPRGAGRAYLFSGASGELLHELRSPNEEADGYFGRSISGTGDVDGDGHGDLLVGASRESPEGSPENAGRAYLFSGASGELLLTLRSPFQAYGGIFGISVSGVRDVDGDGINDLLVGAYGEGSPYFSGRAHVFSGGTGAPLLYLYSPHGEEYGYFGYSVASTGDVNGDGNSDFFVGAPGEDGGGEPWYAGRAYVFSGRPPLMLSASALNSPVPQGRNLRFAVTITNNTVAPLTGDLRLDVTDPDGTVYSQLIHDDGTIGPMETATRQYGVPVRETAPLGTYDATVFALDNQGTVRAEAAFTFEVLDGEFDGSRSIAGGALGEFLRLDGTAATASAPPAGPIVTPNPVKGKATVMFELSEPLDVRVSVYDLLGREVAILLDEAQEAGYHETALDGARLPSGTYLVRLEAGSTATTDRITIVR
jgi:hypothetical protein